MNLAATTTPGPTIEDRTSGLSNRKLRWLTLALVLAATTCASAVVAMHFAEQSLRRVATDRTIDRRDAIATRVDRLRHLTTAMAGHTDVRSLLTGDYIEAASLTRRLNGYLKTLAEASNASLLYVIDVNGVAIASSNYVTNVSLVGKEYSFRPYFQEAIKGKESRYYAVGTTTGIAGYFFARPVYAAEQIVGIVVVKVDLESLQTDWQQSDDTLLLIDEHGISIAANPPQWRFRSTVPITQELMNQFRDQRKYANAALTLLNSEYGDSHLDALALNTADRVELESTRYLVTRAELPDQNWLLIQLTPDAPIRLSGIQTAIAWLLLFGLTAIGWLYWRDRQRREELSREANEAARMRVLNMQLEQEIQERRKAEDERNKAQTELIHSSKMAALGHMSAAVAHEVNQPLSAIRTFCASARLLLKKQRDLEVNRNLGEIELLTDRLATMTSELKVFARKPDGNYQAIDFVKCIRRSLHQFDQTNSGISIVSSIDQSSLYVRGEEVRIEQVIRNLLTNAADATQQNLNDRTVTITLHVDESASPHEAVLRVADNGAGIDDDALEHLFDPFFTTKPVGSGVGLGLSISYGIVKEMGGQIRVRNGQDGGALFSLRLLVADEN